MENEAKIVAEAKQEATRIINNARKEAELEKQKLAFSTIVIRNPSISLLILSWNTFLTTSTLSSFGILGWFINCPNSALVRSTSRRPTASSKKSVVFSYVTTAIAINEQEKQDIESRLLATTRYKTIECIYQVDSSLIGGMVIKMGDRVVDSSIRTKLDKLQRELLAIQL